ncbi:MAG: hypothetical protein QOD70_1762 [Frankiales bacterium]|jgi:hypothetical protein|nr:hypothetical protein [Frankiales bacterium]
MPQIKAVLGNVEVQTAKAKRSCSRHRNGQHKHDILKGELCLVVTDSDGSKHNYCEPSAIEILDRAGADLAALRQELCL